MQQNDLDNLFKLIIPEEDPSTLYLTTFKNIVIIYIFLFFLSFFFLFPFFFSFIHSFICLF